MIPPLQSTRLRSIVRWLKEARDAPSAPEVLEARALEIDEQMIEDFEAMEDALKASLMAKGTWGTEEGLRTFQTGRLSMWQETVAERLPLVG